MRDGLAWAEDPVDAGGSDVIEMLFGSGQDGVAGYAVARELRHEPGSVFNYSSGTPNIVCRILGDTAPAARPAVRRHRHDLGRWPGFDAAGTFVGSSYVHATARDYARFGLLYLRDGV